MNNSWLQGFLCQLTHRLGMGEDQGVISGELLMMTPGAKYIENEFIKFVSAKR